MRRIVNMNLLPLAVMMILTAVSGCKGTKTLLPNVSGKAGEIMVVIERNYWEGALGDEVRTLLTDEVPYLPQKEPLFNLSNVPLAGFTDLFKVHRNILLLQVDPQIDSAGIFYHKDVWATPQSVVQVSAYTPEDAIGLLQDNGPLIVTYFEQAERDRVIGNALLYEERSLADTISTLFGGSPHFPKGYKLRKASPDFAWIAYDREFVYQDILIYKYPITETEPFSAENIIKHRNEVMKNNVPGMFENSYMTTSPVLTPLVDHVKYRGRDFMQTRGLWEVENDYMGGPFVSHSFYSPDGKDMIVAEAFVYAPRYDKRQYLLQVEALLYSWEWAQKGKNAEN